jgi:molybdopterin-guanine dinucleotide biosynthesis protein A
MTGFALSMTSRISPSAILGVLLAGGRAERMGGGDKCLLELGGRPLLAHAVERLRPQVGALLLNANGDPERFAAFGLPVAADTVTDFRGPLAGILAGMTWAREHAPQMTFVATAATDTPFFPRDLVARLSAAIDGGHRLAIGRSEGRDYPVFGLFPVGLADDLSAFLATSPNLAVMAWVDRHPAATVVFASGGTSGMPFLNINRPADLARAEAALSAEKLHKL